MHTCVQICVRMHVPKIFHGIISVFIYQVIKTVLATVFVICYVLFESLMWLLMLQNMHLQMFGKELAVKGI